MDTKKQEEYCPIIDLFSFIWKKWMLLILKSMSEWCKNFSEIERNLEWINPRILSNRLKELESFWFIEAHTKPNTKNKIVYCLTEKWMSFWENIDSLKKWTKKWMK